MDRMNIQLVQLAVTADPEENIRLMKAAIDPAADFALLPELWNCPYDNEKIREATAWGPACRQAMAEAARQQGTWLAGTIPFEEKGHLFNMAFVFNDQGTEVCRYAKTHLMQVQAQRTFYSEAEVFTPGEGFVTFETPWGIMGILVCYDIRFPEPARLLADAGADILLVPAAFNEAVGRRHWEPLLRARAIENQVFVIGVNPVYAWKHYRGWGHSLAVAPEGLVLHEGDGLVQLDLRRLGRVRKRMPYRKIRRRDLYRIECPADVVQMQAEEAGRRPEEQGEKHEADTSNRH